MSYGVMPGAKKAVTVWLLTIAALVLAMILLGGLTRLTESGLSMVDWRPIMGSIPPLNEAQWQETFNKYKAFPEYKINNQGMSLSEFKFIFGMEFSHRLLGRTIGLVFFFPFVFFLIKGWLGAPMIRRGIFLFVLGGLQGLMGWFMVKSGLVDIPRVSQYRLTAHLSLAILVLTLSCWYAFSLMWGEDQKLKGSTLKKPMIFLTVLIGLQITSGGFVAGLDAGHAFNTFPTMNGQWIPAGLWSSTPWLLNFFENPVTVQFIHRCMAYVVTIALIVFHVKHGRGLKGSSAAKGLHLLMLFLVLQVSLGISTLLLKVPVALASLHQMCAIALWLSAIYIVHRLSYQASE